MPNPFPGVNPYIEASGLWPGFRNLLVGDCSRLLNRLLKPRGYAAYVEERLELIDLPDGDESRRPDVMIAPTEVAGGTHPPSTATGPTVLELEPVTLTLPAYEVLTVAYVEVRYLPDQEVVTSIELLSPSNKAKSRAGYIAKRRAVLATEVNLVEVDLLLGGRRPDVIGRIPPGDFCTLVSRGDCRPECQAYAWSIRQPLPSIAIPLRSGDADVRLDLSAAYAKSFDEGPYDVTNLYTADLTGPLSDADRSWVAERIATGRR